MALHRDNNEERAARVDRLLEEARRKRDAIREAAERVRDRTGRRLKQALATLRPPERRKKKA